MAKKRRLSGVEYDYSQEAREAKRRCLIKPDGPANNAVGIRDVENCADKCGSHFFDKGTMRFFKSRVDYVAYTDGKGGAYFATTEKGPGARKASVRHYSGCYIDTVGEFQSYKTLDAARKAAKKLASR
jgi:hypothetical protein